MALACGATACGDPFGMCDTGIFPALQVTVEDSLTQRNLAPDATVEARDGEFTETLVPAGESYFGAEERPGTYTLTVTHAEYEDWVRNAVRVEDSSCGVIPRQITARLEPAG